MAEATSVLTFPQIIQRLAKESGNAYHGTSGTSKSMAPVDIRDLELLKEIANDGIRMFISDAPKAGWHWRSRVISINVGGTRVTGVADAADSTSITDLTLATGYDTDDDLNGWWIYVLTGTGAGSYAQVTDYTGATGKVIVAAWLDQYGNTGGTTPAAADTFAITQYETVDGDLARYPLPESYMGEVSGEIHYAKNTGHSTYISWVHESLIRQRRSVNVITSHPFYAAIRPYEPQVGQLGATRRYELILEPQPSQNDVLQWPYRITFDKLDMEAGVATGGGATTVVDSTRAEGDDYFNGWICTIVDGTGLGSFAIVTDYTGSTGTFTVADWLKADGTAGGTDPAANSIYNVVPADNFHPSGIKFDQTILAACYAQLEIETEDIQSGWMEKYLQKALPMAHQADARGGPRKLGTMNRFDQIYRERVWLPVTNDNDL